MSTLIFIDDDPDFLNSNRLYFEHKGYQVFSCRDPQDALNLLSAAAADCVIMDIDMPGMDGFELCRRLREISRIQARIRRSEDVFSDNILTFGDLTIDTGKRIVTYAGKEGEFSALQFDLLAFLAQNPQKVFSYEQLYDRIWKTPIVESRHNLQVAVATIRQKLNALCDGRQYIKTVSRKGYCFVPSEKGD